MGIFLYIFSNNIVPIFILISFGYIVGIKFKLDIHTLSKLYFYIFVPFFIFTNLYTTDIDLEMIKVILFSVILLLINHFLAVLISRIRGYGKSMENALKNSLMFLNCGNIGLPLVTLVFSSAPFIVDGNTPYLNTAIAIQIIIIVFQNVSTNIIGFLNAGQANMNLKDSIRRVMTLPTIYAIPIALILKHVPYELTKSPIWPSLAYLKDGLIPVALLTLGVQLSRTNFDFKNKETYISVAVRLLIGPVAALPIIYIMGFNGVTAQTVLIAAAVPTAVNTALIAIECNNCEDFSSQCVMISTLFSTITLPIIIYLGRVIFPVI